MYGFSVPTTFDEIDETLRFPFRFVRLGVPWQAHFWIGVRIYDFADMRNALLALEAAPGAKLVTGPLGPNSLVATATESQFGRLLF